MLLHYNPEIREQGKDDIHRLLYDAGWVPLQFQLVGELAGFYMLEVAEAMARTRSMA